MTGHGLAARVVEDSPGVWSVLVSIPDDAWQQIGDDPHSRSRLLLVPTLWLAGCPMHVCAVEVRTLDDGRQVAARYEDEELVDDLSAAFLPDGPWQTTTVDGRSYVTYCEPYC